MSKSHDDIIYINSVIRMPLFTIINAIQFAMIASVKLMTPSGSSAQGF